MADRTLTAALHELEERLLNPAVRHERAAVSALLADDFVEYGASGRVFTKAEILDLLAAESPQRIEMTEFVARLVAPDVALVTYRAARRSQSGQDAVSLRSSLWIHHGHRWQLLFHQGTTSA